MSCFSIICLYIFMSFYFVSFFCVVSKKFNVLFLFPSHVFLFSCCHLFYISTKSYLEKTFRLLLLPWLLLFSKSIFWRMFHFYFIETETEFSLCKIEQLLQIKPVSMVGAFISCGRLSIEFYYYYTKIFLDKTGKPL